MDISLIICSRDRCQQLANCLESTRRIIFERSWELVIVDNGSVDETAIVIQKFSSTSCVPVVSVFEPRPGLGNAHNAALRIARGQILVFTDDDCYPAEDFLRQVWAAFSDPSVGYISGRIMLHDRTDYQVACRESLTPLMFPGGSYVYTGAVNGANMAFRRRVLHDIGGFDPLFGPGSQFNAEDADAAGRASAMGWNGLYCPEVLVSHHHGRKAGDVASLMRSYDTGRGAYHMKLLLHGRRYWWFARCLWGRRRRPNLHLKTRLWETVGGTKYACLYVTHALRSRWWGRTASSDWFAHPVNRSAAAPRNGQRM
jgi:glycosyltransferase involved in cell wall biosynthesis